MRANEFIKKFGWGEAKKTRNPKYETIDNDLHYCTGIKDYTDGFDDYEPCPDCVNIADLKRLVESHELVMDYYGLTRAKEHAESNYTAPELKAALKQAIADVESCQ